MSRSAMRGAVGVWLGLIVLQTVATTGSGRIAGLFGDVNRLLQRALDPTVPAIPDRRAAKPTPAGAPATGQPATPAGGSAPQPAAGGTHVSPSSIPIPGHFVPA